MTTENVSKPALWRRALAMTIDLTIYTELVLVHILLGGFVAMWVVSGAPGFPWAEPDRAMTASMYMIVYASLVPVFFIAPLVTRGIRAKLGLPARKR